MEAAACDGGAGSASAEPTRGFGSPWLGPTPASRSRRCFAAACSRSRRTPDGGAAAGIAAGLSPGAYLTKRGRLSIKPIAFHANAYIPRQSDGSYFRGADGQVQLECAGVGVDFTAKFTGKDANCARNRSSSASGRSRKAADAKASGSAKTLRSGSGTQSESENRARSRLAV